MCDINSNRNKPRSNSYLSIPFNPSNNHLIEKGSPPSSPSMQIESNANKRYLDDESQKKRSLPEIKTPPHHPVSHNREIGVPSTSSRSFLNNETPAPLRGHRRGIGSRGSFDHASLTSFDSAETSVSGEELLPLVSNSGVSLSGKQVRQLFPFHIAVNYDFQIIQMGNGLSNFLRQKTLIKIPTHDHIGKYFRIVSSSASTSSTAWDWFQLSEQASIFSSMSGSSSFLSTASNGARELSIEIELSKDFLLQDPSTPVRLTGHLHKIHPKEDPDSMFYSAFFFMTPKITSKEDFKVWSVTEAAPTSPRASFSQSLEAEEEMRERQSSREVIAEQQKIILRLESEVQQLRYSFRQQQQQATPTSSARDRSDTLSSIPEGEGGGEGQNPATDVRQLIGNVTHDLKTPLGGFLNGLESIKDFMQEIETDVQSLLRPSTSTPLTEIAMATNHHQVVPNNNHTLPELIHLNSPMKSTETSSEDVTVSPAPEAIKRSNHNNNNSNNNHHPLILNRMTDKIHAVNLKIQDITDINNFMTMTINRCIDYAKIGQNLKLKPKLETVDLIDSLSLPLNCMKSLQQRIMISLAPIDERICSSVITDKQWLQENLLCLLSNAVKYSHEGEITVRMFLHPMITTTNTPDQSTSEKYSSSLASWELTEKQRQQFSRVRTERHSFHLGSRTASSLSPSPHRFRTKSLTNEDLQRSGGNSPTRPMHTQHPSLDLSSRLKSTPNLYNPDTAMLTSQSLIAMSPEHRQPNSLSPSSHTIVQTNKGPLILDIPQIDYELFSNQYLVFEVEDQGTGIKEEVREMLFNPFQQAQRLAGGTGLGLFSLSKRIEALYGYYGVEGRRDGARGSLFWFAIPYRPDEEAAKFLAASAISRNHTFAALNQQQGSRSNIKTPILAYHGEDVVRTPRKLARLQSMKTQRLIDLATSAEESPRPQLSVLVVDDSVAITKTVRHALLKKGYKVEVAHNGLDCLNKVQRRLDSTEVFPYDVILMDLNMPVLDGLEAMRRLRQQESERSDHLRHAIIGVSADSDEDTVLEALAAGADDFICKPFSMDTFTLTLQKLQILP